MGLVELLELLTPGLFFSMSSLGLCCRPDFQKVGHVGLGINHRLYQRSFASHDRRDSGAMSSAQTIAMNHDADSNGPLPIGSAVPVVMIHQGDEISESDLVKLIFLHRLRIAGHDVVIAFGDMWRSHT
jgi:hypothetical protein